MRLSAGFAVGVVCASMAQVSSFAFAPLATTKSLGSGTKVSDELQPLCLHLLQCSCCCSMTRVHRRRLAYANAKLPMAIY